MSATQQTPSSEPGAGEMTESISGLDAVTATVIENGLIASAVEMSTTIRRSAFSPLVFEFADYSNAIMSATGRLWAEDPGIIAFTGPMPAVVQHGLAKFGVEGFEPGDVLVANDPYSTGTHVHDTTLYAPVFVGDALVAFTVSTSHWADLGGKHPGGWCPDTTDVFQEGLKFPHVKLVRAGQPDETLFEVILANTRLPHWLGGDIEAQIAACRTGAERVTALCERYGVETVSTGMEWIMGATERAMRAKIGALPDGEYVAERWIDHDGIEKDVPRRVSLRIVIDGESLTADTTGSSETASGPINLGLPASQSAVLAGVKSILLPDQASNDGEMRALTFNMPPDTIVNPRPGAPCDQYSYVLNSLIELTFQAFAPMVPERCPAESGAPCGFHLMRSDARKGDVFVVLEPLAVGWGGRPSSDAPALTYLLCGASPIFPAEILEARYPILLTENALNAGSCGAGEFRGGPGVIREFEALEDGILTGSWMDGRYSPPRGLHGGLAGKPIRVTVRPGSDDETVYLERFDLEPLKPGQRIRAETSGGGGWGNPLERDPLFVVEDVRNELVAEDEARSMYGVAVRRVGEDVELDEDATQVLRSGS